MMFVLVNQDLEKQDVSVQNVNLDSQAPEKNRMVLPALSFLSLPEF